MFDVEQLMQFNFYFYIESFAIFYFSLPIINCIVISARVVLAHGLQHSSNYILHNTTSIRNNIN